MNVIKLRPGLMGFNIESSIETTIKPGQIYRILKSINPTGSLVFRPGDFLEIKRVGVSVVIIVAYPIEDNSNPIIYVSKITIEDYIRNRQIAEDRDGEKYGKNN